MVEALIKPVHRVLLLGEGNFSYALARARLHLGLKEISKKKLKQNKCKAKSKLHLIATSFDTREEVISKYPESLQILEKLFKLGEVDPSNLLQVNTVHRVDATRISQTLAYASLLADLDEITFCHPHIGSENIQKNSALVAHFLDSAR